MHSVEFGELKTEQSEAEGDGYDTPTGSWGSSLLASKEEYLFVFVSPGACQMGRVGLEVRKSFL